MITTSGSLCVSKVREEELDSYMLYRVQVWTSVIQEIDDLVAYVRSGRCSEKERQDVLSLKNIALKYLWEDSPESFQGVWGFTSEDGEPKALAVFAIESGVYKTLWRFPLLWAKKAIPDLDLGIDLVAEGTWPVNRETYPKNYTHEQVESKRSFVAWALKKKIEQKK